MTYGVAVRGPLGAGKTTVARALATALPGAVISIDEILERFEWDGGSEELFRRANDVALPLARAELDRGTPAIFDGNFYWSSILDDLRARLGAPLYVFTLDVPLAICVERDRHRPLAYGEEATRAVFEKVARVDDGQRVDGTGSLAATVGTILARLGRAGVR